MTLLNAFVDSIVCVGFNSERGLTIDRQSDEDSPSLLSFLQPYVLAVFTADQAIYPQSDGKYITDPFYPFGNHSQTSSGHSSNTKSQKKQIIPNTFNNVPLFCSPDGIKVSYLPKESQIHHIVFTQEEGKRSYAVVLTFQQKFILKSGKPDEDGSYQIESLTTDITPSPKKATRARPSAYRHSNATSPSVVPAHRSNSIGRRRHENETSTLDTNGKSVYSSDIPSSTQMEHINSQNNSSNMSNTPLSASRMRSGSTTSLTSIKPHRSTTTLTFDTTEPFYLPYYIVLISSDPYWTAMHEVISTIYNEIQQNEIELNSTTYKSLIQKYAFLACNTPIPPIAWERFSLSFNLTIDQSVITFDPPMQTNRSVLDLDLSILLLTLNIGKLLEVLAAMLTQQPIIFFSSDYSKLVTTLECLLYLIYPFKWIHIYIPIVPYSLRDYYLEGPPGSYIMGVHSRHQSVVEELDSSFTCNLDDDKTIHVPSNTEFHRLPSTKLRRFIAPITDFIEQIKKDRSLQNIHTPIHLRIDEQREYERRHRFETNHKITEIFLDLMVDLCDDTLQAIYWKMDHQPSSPPNSLQRSSPIERKNTMHNQTKFSKEKYLLSKTEGVEREFYRMFIESTAFQLFLEEERTSTAPTEFRKICQLRSQSNQDQPYHFNTTLTDNQIKSTIALFDTTSSQMLLPLPKWPSNLSTHYLDSCIDEFTSELENAQKENSSPIISVYAYLRGCALLARGHLLNGLRDLYLIDNPNLFPKHYIQTIIIPLLSDALLLDRFLQEPFYIQSAEWKKSTDDLVYVSPLPPSTVIDSDLSFEQFHNYVQRSSIVVERDTAEILFRALLHWTNTTDKSSDTNKVNRRWSVGSNPSKEKLNVPYSHQKGSQTVDRSPNASLPAKLFELFLDIWQRTNAEKARMNHYLPKERQKQESILMISSSDITSKNKGRGKLILTQRGLYLLPEGRSSAVLLTELSNIVLIDTYQHKKMFTSSKPSIRIYAFYSSSSTNVSTSQPDSEPLDTLLFKDTYEQNFWYKILFELWAGVFIAKQECDTTVYQKISRHIALMDTLVNIDRDEKISSTDKKSKQENDQTCIDMALNDFTIFSRMQKNGTFKTLTEETRNALHHRLSPSINEIERHAARCLIFTESPDHGYSLLWCAYGEKVKIFNTKTWICDPNELSFDSLITCMCVDACNQLWIGCIDGELFIVDTIQRIRRTQLASIQGPGGCQTMAFDITGNQILIGSRSGLVTIWNAINRQRVTDINLGEIYKNIANMQQRIHKTEILLNLRSPTDEPNFTALPSIFPDQNSFRPPNELKDIQISEDLLFACYRDDYILVFRLTDSNTCVYEQIISVKYQNDSRPINSFLVYNQQLWISACYVICVYNINNRSKKTSYDLMIQNHLNDDHLLTMVGFSDYIWAGSSRGNVYIFRMDNYELLKTFDGHKDGVCCLCPMSDKYIISGSKQFDTSIIIWNNIKTTNIVATTRF